MKTSTLLAASAATFTLVGTLFAADPVLSPKASGIADSLRKVSGETPDLIDRGVVAGSPKGQAIAQSLRKVSGETVDLAHGPRPTFAPKDPRYENAAIELQLAPLK
jgi:hypothetical protein